MTELQRISGEKERQRTFDKRSVTVALNMLFDIICLLAENDR